VIKKFLNSLIIIKTLFCKISPNPSLPAHGRKKTPKRGIFLPLKKGGREGFKTAVPNG